MSSGFQPLRIILDLIVLILREATINLKMSLRSAFQAFRSGFVFGFRDVSVEVLEQAVWCH
jgi:hypothetical protein